MLTKHTFYILLILWGLVLFSYTLLDKKPIEIGDVPLKNLDKLSKLIDLVLILLGLVLSVIGAYDELNIIVHAAMTVLSQLH